MKQIKQHSKLIWVILASSAGMLDFYDMVLMGVLLPFLGEAFLPGHDFQLFKILSIWLIGYLARPIGAFLFGRLGDTKGRAYILINMSFLSALPTFLIGFLPNYYTIGIAAPIILIVLRVLQGLAMGAVWPSLMVYCAEMVEHKKRGFTTTYSVTSVLFGFVLASIFVLIVYTLFPLVDFILYGWRIPFMLSILLALLTLNLRKILPEPPIYTRQKKISYDPITPLKVTFKENLTKWLRVLFFSSSVAMILHLGVFLNIPYLLIFHKHAVSDITLISIISIIIGIVLMLIFSTIGDKKGRKPLAYIGFLLFIILAYPAYVLFHQESFATALIAEVILIIPVSFVIASYGGMIVEEFPTLSRHTSVATTNIGYAILGSSAIWVSFLLIHATQSTYAPLFYMMLCGVLGVISTFLMKDYYLEELERA